MSVLGGGSVVVDVLFIVTPIVGVYNCSMFCCTLLYVHSSIAIILIGKRELVALPNLSSSCLVMVERCYYMGSSVVCDCGISCSYSLTIFGTFGTCRMDNQRIFRFDNMSFSSEPSQFALTV